MGFRDVSCNGTVFSLVLTIGLLDGIVQEYWEALATERPLEPRL